MDRACELEHLDEALVDEDDARQLLALMHHVLARQCVVR
jgi:hypothetical protein